MKPPSPARIPGMPGLPLIGTMLDVWRDPLAFFLRVSREYGDIATLRIGSRAVVMLNSSEYVHLALVEHVYRFDSTPRLRAILGPVIGNGLVTSRHELHRQQRQLVAPAFQHRRVVAYGDVMAAYARRVQDEWADGATIDVAHEMMRLTLWIVGKVLFDADVRADAAQPAFPRGGPAPGRGGLSHRCGATPEGRGPQ